MKTDPAGFEPALLGSKPNRMSPTLWIHPYISSFKLDNAIEDPAPNRSETLSDL